MLTKKLKEDCCAVSNLEFCDKDLCGSEAYDAVQTLQKSNMIQPTDQIIILRNVNNRGHEVYKASFNDLSPEVALLIVKKAIQVMSRTDPSDGCSLWVDEGFIRMASGDPCNLGALSPTAMQKSLAEAFKILPTSDPGDGSPWLNGGVLMQGSHNQ